MNKKPRPDRTFNLLFGFFLLATLLITGCNQSNDSTMGSRGESNSGIGKTGSLARFQIVGEHLYALSGNALHVYGINDPAAITFQNTVEIGFGIETLFAHSGSLYIGSQTGMHIYDIANPTLPVKSSEVTHIRSCDPVVVEGTLAYVTLRSGGRNCWGGSNELQIFDVKDPRAPVKLKTFPMSNPFGLGIDGDKLFICDGFAGLKLYKVGDDHSLTFLEGIHGIEAYDIIPATGNGKVFILIAKEGLFQYDYSALPLKQLSLIKIGT